jgi:hypothetical protein
MRGIGGNIFGTTGNGIRIPEVAIIYEISKYISIRLFVRHQIK